MLKGIILKGVGGEYLVDCCNGQYVCTIRGIFRKRDFLKPLPGDYVDVEVSDTSNLTGTVVKIYDRKCELIRPAVANIDHLLIVISPKMPGPDLFLLDKLLVTANKKGIQCTVCINKTDLDTEDFSNDLIEEYKDTGCTMLKTCLLYEQGYEELSTHLKGRITAFAGQSGVGKSTILNIINKSKLMETGGLSEKVGRGKHTTTHAQLFKLEDGGYIVDTPGFSSFELEISQPQYLRMYYPEFNKGALKCKFNDCCHINEPGCGVKSAVSASLISEGRYDRYKYFYEKLNENRKWGE